MRRALNALLDDLSRKKFAATNRPRKSRGTAEDGRHVSAEVKRTVWVRDRGRCAFVGHGGRRCNERGWVEFHHVVPYARGGRATVDNIHLRCRAHNGYEADLDFGHRRPGGEWAVQEGPGPYGPASHTRSGTSRSVPRMAATTDEMGDLARPRGLC